MAKPFRQTLYLLLIAIFCLLKFSVPTYAQVGKANASISTPYYANGNLYVKGTMTHTQGSLISWSLKNYGYSRLVLLHSKGPYKSDVVWKQLGYPNTGYYSPVFNYSGYSFQYDNFYLFVPSDRDYSTHTLQRGNWVSLTMIVPHGTSLDPNQSWLKRFYYTYTYVKSSAGTCNQTNTNSVDLSSYIQHVKTCTGGNWQSDSSAHWRQCGTCGYVGSGRSGHTWTNVSNATCTSSGLRRCTTCGKEENIPSSGHAWDDNTWQTNGVNHWHRCTQCGETKDVAAHNWTYGNVNSSTHDKTCTICSYRVSGEAHNFVNNRCACGRYNTVVVSFDLNLPTPEDGKPLQIGANPSSIAPITYTYGDLYYESKYGLVEPKLQDYSFAGWWTMEEGGTLITNRKVNNANPHTLYAHWTAIPLNIKNIESNDLYVIENNGQSEANYIKEHAPEDGLKFDYSTTQAEFIPTGENKVIIKDMLLNEDGTSKIALKNWTSYMSKGFSKSEDNGVLTSTYTKDNTPINGKDVTTWENGPNNSIPVEKNKKYHCEAEVMIIGSVKHIYFGHDQGKEANITIKNPSQNTWIKLSKDFTSKNDNITIGTDGLPHVYSGFVIRTLALDDVSPVTMKIRNIKFYEYDDSINISANTNYTYIWESKKPGGEWEPLNLEGVSTDKTTIKIDKANRSINQAKIRLTIRNNAGKKITSNEAKITVYYLPTIE